MTKIEPELILSVVEELRLRGVLYCESVNTREWKKRKWPEERRFYNIVDALLKAYREMDAHANVTGSFKIKIELG